MAGVFFLILSIFQAAGFDAAQALSFIDGPSVTIVFGGITASLLISYPIGKVLEALKATGLIFKPPRLQPQELISRIISLANVARKEGLLNLENMVADLDDPFMSRGIMLIVDGTDPQLVRDIMETEVASMEERHGDIRGVWDSIGSLGPAWGMIGTLIGLVIMLNNLSDPSTLGPYMAVALITTFYGSVIANFFAIPVSSKMKFFSKDEVMVRQVVIEGLLSIQAGDHPRTVEEKLKAFMAPVLRESIGEQQPAETEDR